MKRWRLSLALVGLSAALLVGCAAGLPGGDGVSNGGGLGEKNFVFAFTKLNVDLKSCFTSIDCELSGADEKLLRNIHATLVDGTEQLGNVRFFSPKVAPALAEMEGKPRSARTGTKPGDAIYINTDHLYIADTGGTRPISVRESTGLLIHELGHHHGVGSTEAEMRRLDTLSAKVLKFLSDAEARGGASAADTSLSTRVVPLFSCNSLRLTAAQEHLTVYYYYYQGTVSYRGYWGRNDRYAKETDRFALRIKSNLSQVQVLPDLDTQQDFDMRIARAMIPLFGADRGSFPGSVDAAAARYHVQMRFGGSAASETWVCSLPKTALSQLGDPLGALLLR